MTRERAGKPRNKVLLHGAIVIAVGFLATTLGQTQVLGLIPLRNLLKNELHVDRAANAAFFFWIVFPWYIKPLAGIVTDAVPLFGSRRKSYILASSTLAVISWVGLIFTPHHYGKLLWVGILINTCMMVASTGVGGYMVETAQTFSGSGRLSAIRYFFQQGSFIISGPAGGVLAAMAFGWTPAACAGVMFLLIPTTVWFLHERPDAVASDWVLQNAREQLGNILRARALWAAAGLMALFYIAPGIQTALFYRQQNDLHLGTEAQGFLQMLGGIGAILAATAYGFLCRRASLRRLLISCLLVGTCANLLYLAYSSFARAQAIDSLNGIGYGLAELALMDLSVRATPAGSEGLGFALIMSVRNLALYGTDWWGSLMLDRYHISFNALVLANAATTAIAAPLVLLLPLAIVGRKDAEHVG